VRRWIVATLAVLSTQCSLVLGFDDHEPYPPGDSVTFAAPVLLAAGQQGALGIATDAARVYFVAEVGNVLGAVEKRPNAPVALLAQDLHAPRYVALDDVRVYVGQTGDCSGHAGVVSYLKDGTSKVSATSYKCGDNLSGMALSGTSVFGARGGAAVIAWTSALVTPKSVASGVDGISALAARGADVYFTSTTKGTVNVITPPNPTVVAFAQNQPTPLDVVVDDVFAYWLNANGTLMKVPRATPSAPPLFVAVALPDPRKLAEFADNLYVTCGDGTVRFVPKAGGEAHVIAGGQANPTGIAADLQGVYWTNRGDDTVMMAARR
jgi:hypothetical protein